MHNPEQAEPEGEQHLKPPNLFSGGLDLPVFLISGGLLLLFVVTALFDIDLLSEWVNTGFSLSTQYFGAFWQLLLLLTFLIGLSLTAGRTGSVMLRHIIPRDDHLQVDLHHYVHPAGWWRRFLGCCRANGTLYIAAAVVCRQRRGRNN